MSHFDVEVLFSENQPSKAVLRLVGSLDAFALSQIEKRIQTLIRDEQKIKLVVDCGKLKFISSPGLGLFLGTLNELEKRGGKLIFSQVIHPDVNDAMSCLGFFDIFQAYNSEEEAYRHLDD
ncbi:MAG: STAS domain-containing protein [Deltaproteobacteria bacterium]|nr:MAG: STAS domain-containing protein [Deltaproteobacteria bacterium]